LNKLAIKTRVAILNMAGLTGKKIIQTETLPPIDHTLELRQIGIIEVGRPEIRGGFCFWEIAVTEMAPEWVAEYIEGRIINA